MRQFFLALGLIGTFTVIIILSYVIKYRIDARKKRNISGLIKKKMYQDDRLMLQSRLRHVLPDLESGRINWIVLSVRNDQRIRIELTYNLLNREVEIRDHTEGFGEEHIAEVKKLGAKNYSNDGLINLIGASLNPKIISDIIYYIIEDINQIRSTVNFKLSDSGAYDGKNRSVVG